MIVTLGLQGVIVCSNGLSCQDLLNMIAGFSIVAENVVVPVSVDPIAFLVDIDG